MIIERDGSLSLDIATAQVFQPLLDAGDARYLCAYGGRNGGKSWFFASFLIEQCLRNPGTLAVCIRETQRSLNESAKRNVEQTIIQLGVGRYFEVQHDRIRTPGGGLIIFMGMQDHTAESIKSLEGYRYAWVEEAQTLTANSLALLRPTIRAERSQIWFSWNPRRRNDAVDLFFRGEGSTPDGTAIVKSGWHTNPWHNDVMDRERLLDRERKPGSYDHVWEGGYAIIVDGAYYTKELSAARADGRITSILAEPTLPLKAWWDIGGAGAKGDATAIWVTQNVGQEIRVLDYMEFIGQPLAYIVNELRSRGYDGIACTLPHDGVNMNVITGKRYQDHLQDAGFVCNIVKNQGAGAAAMRIEAVRRILPQCWFNEAKTSGGLEALAAYHEKRDAQRAIGLGPAHDWSSHGADAFGLMAISYEEPGAQRRYQINYPPMGIA
jgi:phage terminase large subunit